MPTDCIDVILNLSSNIFYVVDSQRILADSIHINGLRSKHSYIQQAGNICTFGISFFSFGLYPFVNVSLANTRDEIVGLREFSTTLAQKLELATLQRTKNTSVESIIANIEDTLCFELKVTKDYIRKSNLINNYLESENKTIQSFCAKHGVHMKTFERNVLHYTGYTPKILHSIRRFQKVGNQLVYDKQEQLSDIAYYNGFADQAHFIREFRKFSGVAPRTFQHEKLTVKENVEYTYR